MIRLTFLIAVPVIVLLLIFARRELNVPAGTGTLTPEIPEELMPAPPDPAALAKALAAAIPKTGSADELFSSTCAVCHGTQGEGNLELRAPSIAGLPDWFLLIQLEKFRNGQRGEGSDDLSGKQMKLIAEALTDELMPEVATLIAAMPIVPTRNDIGGDEKLGHELFMENCAACHRYNAHGEKAFRSAPLSNLPDWYIYDSLIKFREETRGYHSEDVDGIFMHRNIRYLTDENFRNIVACIAMLAEKYPPNERRPRNRAAIRGGGEDGDRRSTSLFPGTVPAPPQESGKESTSTPESGQ